MILDSTSLQLQAVLSSPVATYQPEVHVSYFDWNMNGQRSKPATYRTALNGTTDVTILPAPPVAGFIREVMEVNVYNKDTSSVVVTIKTDDGTTEKILKTETLLTKQTLIYEELACGP